MAPGDKETAERKKILATRIINGIREELKSSWCEDSQLLGRLFPLDPTNQAKFQRVKSKHYSKSKAKPRWSIPTSPKSASSLCTPLRMLMNDVLRIYGIKATSRLVLDTHSPSKAVVSDPPSPLSPSLYLSGAGSEFANIIEEGPQTTTHSGICPIEIALDSEDLVHVRDRLAAIVHQILRNQDNRRFAFGLIITETVFTLYMFDHSGVAVAPPCNYHRQPEQFCTLVYGLGSPDAVSIGFDTSLFNHMSQGVIHTFEPKGDGSLTKRLYTVKDGLFQYSSLVGRGTVCWLVSSPDGSNFVIKDAWIATEELKGRESESFLLKHAKSQGITTGIAQIHHFEEVRRRENDPLDLDTVLRNRQMKDPSPDEAKLDRTHTRIVLTTYGRTLDEFKSRKELLFAFHDAVCAHRKLHNIAGILHRDISVRNILINPEGIEGDRGILIDFDHAIRVGNTSAYSAKKKIGTWRYMSRNVMYAKGPHTYLDDLESFYYVLCWILVVFEKPHILRKEFPDVVAEWDHPSALVLKHGFLADPFALPVSPWFGHSLHHLVAELHRFINLRFRDIGMPCSPLDPASDYEAFLGHIRHAIADLDKEDDLLDPSASAIMAIPLRRDDPALGVSQAPDLDSDSDGWSSSQKQPPRRARRIQPVIPLRKRPRRSTANYD